LGKKFIGENPTWLPKCVKSQCNVVLINGPNAPTRQYSVINVIIITEQCLGEYFEENWIIINYNFAAILTCKMAKFGENGNNPNRLRYKTVR